MSHLPSASKHHIQRLGMSSKSQFLIFYVTYLIIYIRDVSGPLMCQVAHQGKKKKKNRTEKETTGEKAGFGPDSDPTSLFTNCLRWKSATSSLEDGHRLCRLHNLPRSTARI